jgi:CBS domain-containing protein
VHAGIEMTVADVMTRNPVTVSVRHSLSSALQTIRARRVSVLPVVEGDELVGLLTARDTCWNLSDLEYREVGAEMDPHPAYVRPDSNLREAAFMLLSQERPALLVVDRGRLVGLLTPRDLLRASIEVLDAVCPPVTTLLTIPQGGGLALAEISSLIRAQGGDLLTTIRESIAGRASAYACASALRIPTPSSRCSKPGARGDLDDEARGRRCPVERRHALLLI